MSVFVLIAAVLGLVPAADNLHGLGCEAGRKEVPLLLYVSRSDCTFCMRLERDILSPLLKSGVVEDKVLIRELTSDRNDAMVGFDGQPTTPAAIARHFDATITPTLLFLNAAGDEVVQRIVGYQPSDYYSYYLEEAISLAGARVAGARCVYRP